MPNCLHVLAKAALDPRMNKALQCREFRQIGKYDAAQLAAVDLAVSVQHRHSPAADDCVADRRLFQRLVSEGVAGEDLAPRLLREHPGDLALAAADAANQTDHSRRLSGHIV